MFHFRPLGLFTEFHRADPMRLPGLMRCGSEGFIDPPMDDGMNDYSQAALTVDTRYLQACLTTAAKLIVCVGFWVVQWNHSGRGLPFLSAHMWSETFTAHWSTLLLLDTPGMVVICLRQRENTSIYSVMRHIYLPGLQCSVRSSGWSSIFMFRDGNTGNTGNYYAHAVFIRSRFLWRSIVRGSKDPARCMAKAPCVKAVREHAVGSRPCHSSWAMPQGLCLAHAQLICRSTSLSADGMFFRYSLPCFIDHVRSLGAYRLIRFYFRVD